MKIFSVKRAAHEPGDSEVAKGCLTANFALPGSGSLAAGRKVGYLQLALCLTGFFLTLIFGVRFISWALSHWSDLHDSDDPMAGLQKILAACVLPFIGFVLVALAWIWALATSMSVIQHAQKKFTPPKEIPPLLK